MRKRGSYISIGHERSDLCLLSEAASHDTAISSGLERVVDHDTGVVSGYGSPDHDGLSSGPGSGARNAEVGCQVSGDNGGAETAGDGESVSDRVSRCETDVNRVATSNRYRAHLKIPVVESVGPGDNNGSGHIAACLTGVKLLELLLRGLLEVQKRTVDVRGRGQNAAG